jgi:hypothetical protein
VDPCPLDRDGRTAVVSDPFEWMVTDITTSLLVAAVAALLGMGIAPPGGRYDPPP